MHELVEVCQWFEREWGVRVFDGHVAEHLIGHQPTTGVVRRHGTSLKDAKNTVVISS